MRTKKHRLPGSAYIGKKTVSFTACVDDRKHIFVSPRIVEPFIQILEDCAARNECVVPIYCFMPDHLHVLIQGTTDVSRPKRAMDQLKEDSGEWLLRNHPNWGWQRDYHDHILRKGEDWRRHAFYVLQNPMRAGLVSDPYTYPFTGSIGFDLVELLHEIAW